MSCILSAIFFPNLAYSMPHIIKKLSNLSTYFKKNKAISTEVPGIRLKAVEGLGTIESNGILGHDFLPNWMIFFHLSTTWLSDLYITKKCDFC